MKQSFGTGTRALSSALALSLAVNVWPVTPVVVMAEEPAGPTVLQGILQGPEDESEPSEAPVIVEQAVPDDGVHGEEGGGYGQPGGEVAAEPSDEGGVVGEDVSPVVEEPAAGDDVGEAGQAADAEDRQGEEEAAASADGHAVVDESALAFIYVGQASYAPTDIARAAFVLNGDAAVAEASLHFGGEGFEDVCQADVIEGGAMRFSMDAAGLGWGFVAFTALDVVLENGDSFTVDLSDGFAGAYGFEVSGAVTYSDSAPEVQTTVYSARGEELVGESLEAMAEGAGVQGSQRARSSAGGPIVIALDAGHDESLHPGADGRGLQEAVLTLEIARYAKEELETYPGVEVYMVRDSGACPYPNAADEAEELRLRVEGAVAAGAHAYVSIHLNSYDGGDASGAEIWYPNSHTNATVGSAGQELSQEILDQLTSLGLYDRGVKDNGTLSDGVRDYYSVIRNSKAHGVPGIIVEHAFITSGSDYGYLSTEEGLRSLGVADAQGIANYFNLRKDGEGEARAALTGNVTLGSVGGTGRTFELVARNVSCSQGVNGVSVGVRCVDDDSQVRWYPLVLQADGTWRATVSIDDFGGAMGTYAVVGALNDSAWNSHVFSSSNVQVAWEQLAGAVSVGPYDPSDGTVEVVATGVRCATGVRGVSVGVWYDADGEASSRWYALSDRGDGTWGVRVPLADLGGRSGSYSVRAALSDGSWAARLFGLARADVSVPAAKVTASFDEGAAALKVEVSGGPVPRATNVAFCVVGPSGSTRWYQASRDAGGAWSASVPRADHGAGACTVGAWATVGGTTSEVARSRANVPAVGSPSGAVSVGPYDPSDGTVEVVATGVRCATGVRGVSVGVWYDADGEASSRWYALSDRGDGTWGVRVPLADLGGRSGSYSVRAALSDGSWAARLFGLARADVSVPAAKVTASFDEGAAALKVEVSGGPVPRATNVAFCVVGPSGSTRWYQASRDAGGAWSASVPRADHGAGACTVGAWATVGGTTSEVARSRANVPAVGSPSGAVSVGPYDPSDGTVEVVATGVRCATGVRGVSVGVWYDADGEASSRWYALSDRGDGTWGVRVPLADLGGRSGSYSVRAALSDGSWAARLFGLARADVSVPAAKVTASFDEGAAALKVEVSGGPVPRATNVAFCVVGPSGSTRWYQASRDAGGAWSASVPRADHGAGACTVGAWATVGGTTSEVARSRANITAQPLVKGALTATMTDGGTGFLLSAQGGSFSDARNVAFALVDPSGRTQWIQAHHDGHGVWRAVAGLSGLGAGPCRVEAWASVRDTTEPLGSVEFSTKLHAIMGKGDDGLVQAFADAYRRTGKAYPAAAYKDKGAPTIDDFCRILVREAVAEGVDPRVVYAQAMLETGYLQFGADVLPGQCNFCGLGATGAGQKGAVFENVALGLRAQVQHLKAYGSKDSLVNACVDPRFSFVSRGVAPYVEGLGGRWAISATYGYSLSKIIDSFS